MDEQDRLAVRFEANRRRLRSLAYRVLGSTSDADDALQEAWIRVQRSATDDVANFDGWLTTVVSRISLNILRDRRARRESAAWTGMPDPLVTGPDDDGPEQQLLTADSVGLAMLVVLDKLSPGERVAFVLYDVFGIAYSEIARVIGCSEPAARQLASRARRRVREAPTPSSGLAGQRKVVDAFFTAARSGRLDDLVAVLHPEVVLRVDFRGPDGSPEPQVTAGAADVASRARQFASPARQVVPVVVNGTAGVVILTYGQPFSIMEFAVVGDTITAIDVVADPVRVKRLYRASGAD